MYFRKSFCLIAVLLLFPYVVSFADSMLLSSSQGEKEFFAATSTVFERGPLVTNTTSTSATLYWRTNSSENSTVHYGTDSSLGEVVGDTELVTSHRIILEALSPNQKYYYQVVSGQLKSEMYHFRTAPTNGSEFRLVIAGDNRPDSHTAPIQPQVFRDIADLIIKQEPHIIVLTGDFVYRVVPSHEDNLEAWRRFNEISDMMGHYAPVVGVVGNHDTSVIEGSLKLDYFYDAFFSYAANRTYFSFDYAGVHFSILDSEENEIEGRITGGQYEWLVQDLQNTQSSMKFVFAHRPLYPVRHIGNSLDVNITERNRLQQLFEDENVTLFAAGHDHCYNRIVVNGVLHYISGGAGAPLYTNPWGGAFNHFLLAHVSHKAVNVTAITLSETVAEEYLLPYEGPIEIFLRGFANGSKKAAGTVPAIHFSEVPVTKFYSWDGSTNSSVLTGFPAEAGLHTLDVYAENDEGVWSHVTYQFETQATQTETTPTETDVDSGAMLAIASGAAVVVIVIVLAVVIKNKHP